MKFISKLTKNQYVYLINVEIFTNQIKSNTRKIG